MDLDLFRMFLPSDEFEDLSDELRMFDNKKCTFYYDKSNVLKNNMEELALTKMLEILPNVIDKSTKNKTSLVDSLLELTNAEIEFRAERAKKINITTSHFPYINVGSVKNFL